MKIDQNITAKFLELYDSSDEPIRHFFAPGRVNIIGDHIDYNGGNVFPAAISIGIMAYIRKRKDQVVRLASTSQDLRVRINLEDPIVYDKGLGWGNYPAGVLHYLLKGEVPIEGADILFHSNLPVGSGLSSSACLEVLTGYMFMTLANKPVDRTALALLCQLAENEFVGVKCGIMDQFAIANGKEGHAMFLDCNTLQCEYVPFNIDPFKLVILDSKKPRELVESKYNERILECSIALKLLKDQKEIDHLSQASFSDVENLIEDPVIQSRARHVVWENQYVLEVVESLKDGDLIDFGESLDASHLSLANDYEVSGVELDMLVDLARQVDGCIGARMTGAGFGGCAIAVVHEDNVEEFKDFVGTRYKLFTEIEPAFYVCDISNGVEEIMHSSEENNEK